MVLRFFVGLVFIVLVCAAIYPWRVESWQRWNQNDYTQKLSIEMQKAKQLMADTNNLPITDERRRNAMEQMADVYWRSAELEKAEQLFSEVWISRDKDKSEKHDQRFEKVMLLMAGLKRDLGNFSDSFSNYKSVHWYDTTYVDKNTPKRLVRDLNNLGVGAYSLGQSKPDKAEGLKLFEEANKYFDEALIKCREVHGVDSQMEGMILGNKFLALRDMGSVRQADEAKHQSERILALVKRPARLP